MQFITERNEHVSSIGLAAAQDPNAPPATLEQLLSALFQKISATNANQPGSSVDRIQQLFQARQFFSVFIFVILF